MVGVECVTLDFLFLIIPHLFQKITSSFFHIYRLVIALALQIKMLNGSIFYICCTKHHFIFLISPHNKRRIANKVQAVSYGTGTAGTLAAAASPSLAAPASFRGGRSGLSSRLRSRNRGGGCRSFRPSFDRFRTCRECTAQEME